MDEDEAIHSDVNYYPVDFDFEGHELYMWTPVYHYWSSLGFKHVIMN